MAERRHRRRRWLRALAVLMALPVLLVLTVPLWVSWVSMAGLRFAGVEVGGATRQGYSGVLLSRSSYRFEGGSIRVELLSVPSLAQLLGFYVRGGGEPVIEGSGWTVVIELETREPRSASEGRSGVGIVMQQVDDVLDAVGRWLPAASLRDGRVWVAGKEIACPKMIWTQGVATLGLTMESPHLEVQAELDVSEGGRWRLDLTESVLPVTGQWEGSRGSEGWGVRGEGAVRGRSWRMGVEFPMTPGSVWPSKLSSSLADTVGPAWDGGLYGFEQGEVDLAGTGSEQGLDFVLRFNGRHAHQVLGDVSGVAEGAVDARGVRLRRVDVQAALGGVGLREPVAWGWGDGWGDLSMLWEVRANVARQPWAPLEGELRGDLDTLLSDGAPPRLKIGIRGDAVRAWGVPLGDISLEADCRWPVVETGALRVAAGNGSVLSLDVRGLSLLDHDAEEVELRAEVLPGLEGALPEGMAFSSASLLLSGGGGGDAFRHEGALAVKGLMIRGMHMADTAMDWRGEGWGHVAVGFTFDTGRGHLKAEGELLDLRRLELSALSLAHEGAEALELARPADVSWERGSGGSERNSGEFTLQVSEMVLANGDQHAAVSGGVQWPRQGAFEAALSGLDLSLGEAFFEMSLPSVGVERLGFKGGWNEGPMAFDLDWSGTVADAEWGALRSVGSLRADGEGLTVESLVLMDEERRWAELSGRIPVVVRMPGLGPWLELKGGEAMALDAVLEPSAVFEHWLKERWGVGLTGAEADVHVRGTPLAPEGEWTVKIGSVAWTGATNAAVFPFVGPLELKASLFPDRVSLDPLRVEVAGHSLVGKGELPLEDGVWVELLGGRWVGDLSRMTGELELGGFPLAAVGSELLGVLRPEGKIEGTMRLKPGWRWEGDLGLSGVATRAFPLVGPIRGIEGRILVEDQQATLTGLDADIGGGKVRLTGVVDASVCWREPGELPTFDLTLTGEGLPLARQAGLIVRSDLDVNLVRQEGQATLVRGDVQLKRSFVLSDLEAVLGTGVRRVLRPPPYFSVRQAPMASWRLDLAIRGDRCVHVKSPFYRGVHSVNLRLRGTMQDPVLTGDVQVDEGRVVFPYAAVPVRQGIVTFSEQDPDEPRVVVVGGSRTFGYDLRMEVGGTLREPTVQFSSTPSLTSEEVVMMITAGELPRREQTTTTQDRLAKLATLVGKDILNKLGAQDAGEERLIIRSGEAISTTGRVTHYLEYRLTDQWGLVGEYDEYDAINAGVKWRIIRR